MIHLRGGKVDTAAQGQLLTEIISSKSKGPGWGCNELSILPSQVDRSNEDSRERCEREPDRVARSAVRSRHPEAPARPRLG